MKRYLILLFAVIVILSAVIYQNKFSEKEITVYAMDTVMTIKIKGDEKILKEAEKLLYDIDYKFNAYNKSSYIYRLNEGMINEVPDDVAKLIEFSLDMCYETEGCFNIALKELKDLWNLTGENPKVPTEDEINKALLKSDFTEIKVEDNKVNLNGMKIDLGGIVKGYAADCIVELFKSKGIKETVIDLGGNVYAYSNNKDIKVGVQKPFSQRGDVICVTNVRDNAVISSGTYERYFKQNGKVYHHIFDPHTGYPADSSTDAVTVVGKNSAECDAYSTALLVMGREKAAEFYNKHNDFEFLMISKSDVFCSPGFNGEAYDKSYIVEAMENY